jgi:mRNA-degrading endonuclease toxin of MazEF toxin-antitoxin module
VAAGRRKLGSAGLGRRWLCVKAFSFDKRERFEHQLADHAAAEQDADAAKQSVANVSQIVAVDKSILTKRAGRIRRPQLELVFAGLDLVLGR